MKYAQLVVGPAGSGKSTYCSVMQKHAESCKRVVHVVNLDPAAEKFDYDPSLDIRDLISLDDVMEDDALRLGPNGGLVYCMEYLLQNKDWLHEQLGEATDDYLVIDCPGQIELYTHMSVMRELTETLRSWEYSVCAVFVLDATFMLDSSKFIAGTLTALSAMVILEVPHVNILTKMDLLSEADKRSVEESLTRNFREETETPFDASL